MYMCIGLRGADYMQWFINMDLYLDTYYLLLAYLQSSVRHTNNH